MFKFDLNISWLEFINQNLKWCIGVLLRSFTFILIVFLCIYIFQFFINKNENNNNLEIKNIKTIELKNESIESKIQYKDDIKKINDILKKLEKNKNINK